MDLKVDIDSAINYELGARVEQQLLASKCDTRKWLGQLLLLSKANILFLQPSKKGQDTMKKHNLSYFKITTVCSRSQIFVSKPFPCRCLLYKVMTKIGGKMQLKLQLVLEFSITTNCYMYTNTNDACKVSDEFFTLKFCAKFDEITSCLQMWKFAF